jgi:cytochrome c oxidase cbb3-type subunit I
MSTTPSIPADSEATAERIAIDHSTRGPVLIFFISAVVWLLAATFFGIIDSFKQHNPEFLGHVSWLTYGRIHAAYLNALTLGWGTTGSFGVIIWLLARLDHARLRIRSVLVLSCWLWNIGLGLGILGVLGGLSTGIEFLELPGFAAVILFVSYSLMAVWGVVNFAARDVRRPLFISQLYLLAALFWFPWAYGSAQFLLHFSPVQGSIQGIVASWYAHNFLTLWFTPIGLAAAYYFIPKVTGKPIYSYSLANIGFWTFALFVGWNGAYYLTGGPYPVWVVTASIVAAVLMLIPVSVVAINHHMTVKGSFALVHSSPTLRFVVFGAIAYTVASVQEALMGFRTYGKFFDYTLISVAHVHLVIYGFFSMILFGAIYYIMPRLIGCEWRSAMLIRLHFAASFFGILLMMAVLHVGGVRQGIDLSDATVTFEQVTAHAMFCLTGRTAAMMLLTLANFVFAYHFVLMLLHLGLPAGKPTLLSESPAVEKEAATL